MTEAEYKESLEGFYYALKTAYYSGILSASYADHSVTHRSRADMRQQIDELETELGISSGSGPKTRVGVFRKGL